MALFFLFCFGHAIPGVCKNAVLILLPATFLSSLLFSALHRSFWSIFHLVIRSFPIRVMILLVWRFSQKAESLICNSGECLSKKRRFISGRKGKDGVGERQTSKKSNHAHSQLSKSAMGGRKFTSSLPFHQFTPVCKPRHRTTAPFK